MAKTTDIKLKWAKKHRRKEIIQRFFNFAYSIGAAVVIWGALFKILHLPGGNLLLTIGMGTEVAMFIITAFDRPSKEYEWEEVFPELDHKRILRNRKKLRKGEISEEEMLADETSRLSGGGGGGSYAPGVVIGGGSSSGAPYEGDLEEGADTEYHGGGYHGGGGYVGGGVIISGGSVGGSSIAVDTEDGGADIAEGIHGGPSGVIIAGGGAGTIGSGMNLTEEDTVSLKDSIAKMAAAADQLSQMAELTTATQDYLSRIAGIADQMTRLQETTAELNEVSSILLDSYKAITDNSASISESSSGYVESMADLNRNIGGLNTIYEIQLKSISSQLESIDRVNRGLKDIRDMYEKSARQSSRYCEETERMTRYMTQLNSVYEKMVTAMTINMYNPMMGQPRRNDEFNPYASSENGVDQQEAN